MNSPGKAVDQMSSPELPALVGPESKTLKVSLPLGDLESKTLKVSLRGFIKNPHQKPSRSPQGLLEVLNQKPSRSPYL